MSDLERRITDIQINHLFIGEENGFSIWLHWIPTSSPFCGDVTWYLVRPKLLTTFIGVSPNYRHFPQKNTLDIENTRGICLCPLFWAVYHTYVYIYAFIIFIIMSIFSLYLFFCTHGTLFTISRVSATALCVFTKCCGMSCCMRSWRTAGSKQLSCNGEKAQLFINTNIKQICAYEKRIKPICTFISMRRGAVVVIHKDTCYQMILSSRQKQNMPIPSPNFVA